MTTYNEEILYQLHNDRGEYIQVSEDFDGLGLVEIRSYDNNGKLFGSLVLTIEQAEWLRFTLPDVIEKISK